jgi:hypothetical protein
MNKPDTNHRDWHYSLLCALVVVGAMALTIPAAECGVNDDWSYTKTALDLAQTGHLIYNGWAAATLGAQAYWGALFIKLFGFSFLAVRLSTAPLAAGCAVLLYALHRRAGLPPGLAIFGALTIALSPAFILNAVTFMTDIPSLFFLLASAYGYVRAAGVLDGAGDSAGAPAPWRKPLGGWVLFALVAGVLGGTVRQTGWIMPVFAPLLLLVRRRTFQRLPPARLPLALSSVLACGAALGFVAWYQNQPYAVPEEVFGGFPRLLLPRAPLFLCRLAIRILLTLTVFILPLLVVLPALYRLWLRERPAPGRQIRGVLLLTALFGLIAWKILDYSRPFPWFDTTFIFPYLLGAAPVPSAAVVPRLPMACREMISVGFIALVSGNLALWVATAWWWPAPTARTAAPGFRSAVFALFAGYAMVYVLLLLLKGLVPDSSGVFDRYLLPLLPAVTLGLLMTFHQWTGRDRPPLSAWLVLALFVGYSVAQAHDYFAQLRARVVVTGGLEQRGIPRTRILAGFEYDSWTQITVAGHYNDSRIRNPAGSYVPPPKSMGFETVYVLWKHAPVVRPDYVVALARHPGLLDTDVPPVGYSCWLPPFERRLYVQTRDPALTAVPPLPARLPP